MSLWLDSNMENTTENLIARMDEIGRMIGYSFTYEAGPKFIRVVEAPYGQRSVHAFIDRSTGDLIKSGGWKAPAKDKTGLAVRGNLLDDADFDRLLRVCDPYGGYLYKGAGVDTPENVEKARRTRERAAETMARITRA